jgi:hypothetical protein
MTRQNVYITMMQPVDGLEVGPMTVPERNHPRVEMRLWGLGSQSWAAGISNQQGDADPIPADPTKIHSMPSNAVKIRNTKNATAIIANEVPTLSPKNSTTVTWLTYHSLNSLTFQQPPRETLSRLLL